MKFREVKKGMYIINIKTLGSSPWWVANKYTGMVIIRRRPKVGKMVALTTRQLCQFIEIDIRRWNARWVVKK